LEIVVEGSMILLMKLQRRSKSRPMWSCTWWKYLPWLTWEIWSTTKCSLGIYLGLNKHIMKHVHVCSQCFLLIEIGCSSNGNCNVKSLKSCIILIIKVFIFEFTTHMPRSSCM
jgi:hypothetical protein